MFEYAFMHSNWNLPPQILFQCAYSTLLPEAHGQHIRLTEASVIIGLSPPRQRPGCALELNLDYAEVSL